MNKEKLIEKIDEYEKLSKESNNQSYHTGYEADYAQGRENTLLMVIEDLKEIIQSEPEETRTTTKCAYNRDGYIIAKHTEPRTNFDVFTESPEKLAEFIMEVQNDTINGKRWLIKRHCVEYLNQKVGE